MCIKFNQNHFICSNNLYHAEPGIISCFCKQCRSRSVGFWRSQLIWICSVCQLVSEFISTIWIKESDWLKIINEHDILIYSAWQGLRKLRYYIKAITLWRANRISPFMIPNHSLEPQYHCLYIFKKIHKKKKKKKKKNTLVRGQKWTALFVLRFYGPVNPMGSCRARSVYLTTRLLGRLSPPSG